MSFESRFAAFGRAIDDMIDALRHRAPRSSPSRGPGAALRVLSERIFAAMERPRAVVADRSGHLFTPGVRRRLGVTVLILASIALSAVITRQLTGGGPIPADASAAQSLAPSPPRATSVRLGSMLPRPMRSMRDPLR